MMPARKKRPRMGVRESSVIRSPGHLKFVRGFSCALFGKHECNGKTEAAHVRIGTDGGIGQKPSDCYVLPLCSEAHREQHQIGEQSFEKRYGVKMKEIAEKLWNLSPHGKKWNVRHEKGHKE